MFRLINICIVFCLCFIFRLNAQTLKFENYTTKDGLISNEVYKIFQDKKGYVWLFTNYGVMKYNGKQFNQVLTNLPFNESFIYSYYENDKGQLWLANSNSKLYEVRNDSALLINGTEGISNKLKENVIEILDLYVNSKGDIILSTQKGTYKLHKAQNYYKTNIFNYSSSDSIFVTVLYEDDKLLSSINDLYRTKLINTKNDFYINYFNKEKLPHIIKFKGKTSAYNPLCFEIFKSDMYFCFYNEIVKITKNLSPKYIYFDTYVLNYKKDRNNHLWVGTFNDGLYELNEQDSIVNHYFNGKTINHIVIDSQNGLWVSTDGSGLYHCKNFNEIYFNSDDKSLLGNVDFMKKIENKIFLSNTIGGIFVVDENVLTNINRNNKANSELLDIIKYDEGYLICYRFNFEYIIKINNEWKISTLDKIRPAFFPLKIFNLGKDSILCLARNSILILPKGIKDLKAPNKIIKFNHKVFSFCYNQNILFFATDDGVQILINEKLFQPEFLLPTKNCLVTKICQDQLNNLWFCTKGYGLFKLSLKNEITHYTVKNDLPSNIINDISFSTDNTILLSTNIGLYKSSKYKKWIEVSSEQVQVAFGFRNDIYFKTNSGLVINRDNKINEINPTYFNLSSIKVNGLLKNSAKLSTLTYKENFLEFDFDIISFCNNNPGILYQIVGKKNEAKIVSGQEIIFQNLLPGNYTLTASLADNNIKAESIVIPFNILPAFWQTTSFKLFTWFLILLISCFVPIVIFKYFKRKEDKKNKISKIIAEYKLIALKAQINPHFMSNCLTAIQYLILNNKFDEAIEYLAKFSLLVRQVLDFSTRGIVTLKEELTILGLNIELEQLRFDKKMEFSIEYNNDIDVEKILIPPLLLQPLVENAIWHGLLPINGWRTGILMIKIVKNENTLNLIIEDNGVGRFKGIKNVGNLKESKGIEITQQRIANLNTLYNFTSGRLEYEDLYNPEKKSIGTRAIIILPIIIESKNE